MRTAIIGAGALGSVLGGLLTEAGVKTILIERDPNEVETIRTKGLWLEGVSGERLIFPEITANANEAGPCDLVLTLVKSYDTAAAGPNVGQALGRDGVVLTLQNGIGNFETLEAAFPGRVILGTTTVGAMRLDAGKYRHTGFGQTHIGEISGQVTKRVEAVVETLSKTNAGPVHVTDNAAGGVWSKLIINAAINAPATLLRLRNGDLPGSDAGRELIHTIVQECLEIVRKRNVKLIFEDPEAVVLEVCKGTATNICSMFQDILAGRRTEIDFINGALADHADSLKIPAPVNRTLYQLIKALESCRKVQVG
jgi:2-dehydropantoate 2-reductase